MDRSLGSAARTYGLRPAGTIAWLADQNIVNTDRVLLIPLRGKGAAFNILDVATRQWWVEIFRKNNVGYVVWDCLRPVIDVLGLDEHTGVGPLLVAFDQVLADADVPDATVVHHMGHSAERSRGDSRIRDWPDVEWRLVRESEDPSSPRYVSAYGRDVDLSESRLDYDPSTRRLTLVGGNRRTVAADRATTDLLEYLTENPESTTRAIEDHVTNKGHSRGCCAWRSRPSH